MRAALPALAILSGLLAACDVDPRPDDLGAARAPQIVRLAPVEEALVNAQIPTLDPGTLNDARIREVIGAGSRCEFRYTQAGRPVLAFGAPPEGGSLGGVVQVNGHLVRLDAQPAAPSGLLLLTAGPVRLTVSPDGGAGNVAAGNVTRREADLVFEVGEELRVGYRGYLSCGAAR